MQTRFEWDEAKNRSNQRKHRISFEVASQVFADPFALMAPEWVENGEERWQTIGAISGRSDCPGGAYRSIRRSNRDYPDDLSA